MTKSTSRLGSDTRYLYWSGGARDRYFYNGGTALAIVLNWLAVGYAYSGISSSLLSIGFDGRATIAMPICGLTMLLVRHPDTMVRTVTRTLACALPMVFLLLAVMRGDLS